MKTKIPPGKPNAKAESEQRFVIASESNASLPCHSRERISGREDNVIYVNFRPDGTAG